MLDRTSRFLEKVMLNDFSAQADMRSRLVLALGVFRLCTLLGQNPLSTSCCRGSYLLNTLMFIIFLWSRNTGWATSSRTPLRMASGRRLLSQERLYWWSLRWVGRLGRLPVAWSLAAHWCWSMSALLCITRSFAPARVTFCKSLDCAGWPALYRGHSLLRFRPPVILPRVMASPCAGRKHLSLLRRALLCCPAAHLTRKRLQLISTVLQSRGLIG